MKAVKIWKIEKLKAKTLGGLEARITQPHQPPPVVVDPRAKFSGLLEGQEGQGRAHLQRGDNPEGGGGPQQKSPLSWTLTPQIFVEGSCLRYVWGKSEPLL